MHSFYTGYFKFCFDANQERQKTIPPAPISQMYSSAQLFSLYPLRYFIQKHIGFREILSELSSPALAGTTEYQQYRTKRLNANEIDSKTLIDSDIEIIHIVYVENNTADEVLSFYEELQDSWFQVYVNVTSLK